MTTDSADVALHRVLAEAGTILPCRDAVDQRLVRDVRTGKGRVIREVSEVGGWPLLSPGTPPADSDRDGMPDAWEKEHALNRRDADDSRLDADGDGYTNIEEYLNGTDPGEYVAY